MLSHLHDSRSRNAERAGLRSDTQGSIRTLALPEGLQIFHITSLGLHSPEDEAVCPTEEAVCPTAMICRLNRRHMPTHRRSPTCSH